MRRCKECGRDSDVFTSFDGRTVCFECKEKLNKEKVQSMIDGANEPRDYEEFSADELADAFWISLGKYIKHPNKKDLKKMNDMFLWACHDSHAQYTNFANALKWCNIDLWIEKKRTDLTDE